MRERKEFPWCSKAYCGGCRFLLFIVIRAFGATLGGALAAFDWRHKLHLPFFFFFFGNSSGFLAAAA